MSGTIDRAELVAEILADRPDDLLVVCGLGSSTYDVAGVEDHPHNFYLWGAMGQALSVGLGIAIAHARWRSRGQRRVPVPWHPRDKNYVDDLRHPQRHKYSIPGRKRPEGRPGDPPKFLQPVQRGLLSRS